MLLHIAFSGGKPFQAVDQPMVKALQEIGLEVGWDYEYLAVVGSVHLPQVIQAMRDRPNHWFVSGGFTNADQEVIREALARPVPKVEKKG